MATLLREASTGGYKTIGPEVAVNPLSDQITPNNQINDIIILLVTVDGARTVATPAGFTTVTHIPFSGITFAVYWRRATAVNEALPDVTISAPDGVAVGYYVVAGCPTDSTPIGNSQIISSTSSSPQWSAIDYNAGSTIMYLGGIGSGEVLTVGAMPILLSVAEGTVANVAAYATDYEAGNTGIVIGTATLSDIWFTMALELLTYDPIGAPPAVALNIAGIAGDTLDNWTITFIDAAGNPIDISSYDFYWIVKSSYSAPDSTAVVSKGPADALKTDSGLGTVDTLQFVLSAAETEIDPGTYVHAIKVVSGSQERTWFEGGFRVAQRRIDTV